MVQKSYIVCAVCAVALVAVLIFAMYVSPQKDEPVEYMKFRSSLVDPKLEEMIEISNTLIKQRNDISQQLNLKQQKLGQLACKDQEKNHIATSETGGWCQKSSKENSGHHMTDRQIAPALADFFKGKTVASFGDGPGRYKQLLLESGKVKGYDAYDGAPYCDTTSEGRVKFLDLTLPQFGLPLYDWVMSLEVAEHIPARFEHIYIDNIVRHAREGVVLSWAVPGQGGYSHVNNRPFEYVKNLMDKLGFSHDKDASEKLQKAANLPWLQKNTNVYRRRELYKIDKEGPFFT